MVAVADSLVEINSFVSKFHSLWKTGRDACLQIETHAGQACVTLRLGLGEYPRNQQRQENIGQNVPCEESSIRRKLSPSKIRHKARRAAARASTAESVVEKAMRRRMKYIILKEKLKKLLQFKLATQKLWKLIMMMGIVVINVISKVNG